MIIKRFVSLFKTSYFKVTLLIALFLTSALIIIAMLLGNEAGSFVIRVQEGSTDKSIAITLDKDDKSSYTRSLEAPGATNFSDNSPAFFLHDDYKELNEITSHMGGYLVETNNIAGVGEDEFGNEEIAANRSLYCYTFYIVNTGTTGVNVNSVMSYSNVTKDLDDVIRVMSYYTDEDGREVPHIYQKTDKTFKQYEGYNVVNPEYFVSDGKAFSEKIYIGINKAVKYSVFFWLEGEDPELDPTKLDVTKYYGATIKFQLDISVDMSLSD